MRDFDACMLEVDLNRFNHGRTHELSRHRDTHTHTQHKLRTSSPVKALLNIQVFV